MNKSESCYTAKLKMIMWQFCWGSLIFMMGFYYVDSENSFPTSVHVSDASSVKVNYVEQPLDHFNPLNSQFWKQKYFVNEEFYKTGSPIFVMVGGETPIAEKLLQEGSMIELCKKLNGIAFNVEHRFVGGSFPINNTELESLSYMNIQQALADYANFIIWIKYAYKLSNNKVILVGGSYPGSLAVFMRMKYPHLVDIVWSTGAIIKHEYNFPEYFELTGRVIKDVSSKCYDVVQAGFDDLEKLVWKNFNITVNGNSIEVFNNISGEIKLDVDRCKIVEEEFKLCEPLNINNEDDIRNFFQYLAQLFHHTVQYNGRNLKYTIENMCKNIFENTTDSLTAIQKIAKFTDLENEDLGLNCTDFTQDKFCEQLSRTGTGDQNVTAGVFDDSRQWWWLTCSQIANFQSSDGLRHPLGRSVPSSFLLKQCQCVFGKRFTKDYMEAQIQNLKNEFGDLEGTKSISRVLFVNGANDPWLSRGVCFDNETAPENKVILIKGASHCFDLCATKSTDAQEVTEARLEIHSQIEKWLLEG